MSPGIHQHLAIIRFAVGRPSQLHTHDFPEVFWLETGTGTHWINGQRKRLDTGDLVVVRPEDQHRLEAVDSFGFTLINLAFDPEIRRHLLSRYGAEMSAWLAPIGPLPVRLQLKSPAIFSLRRQVESLARAENSLLALEHFLLGLPSLGEAADSGQIPALEQPDWLRRACSEVQRPEIFARGAAGFVRVAGRSAEHVARTTRAVLGLTPSDYVNRVRMDYAARELRFTPKPIAQIALDCGIGNLSHFYAVFKKAQGMTPRSYRIAHQRIVA